MPGAAAKQRQTRETIEAKRYEAFLAWQQEQAPIRDASETLDPQGFMQRRASQLVAEYRANGSVEGQRPDYDPMTDLLGGARMVAAFEDSGRDATEAIRNHQTDIRTAFTEALFKGGHISQIEAELNNSGEAAIGDLVHWELFLRAAPKSNPEVCAAEVTEEFLSAALYNRPDLRQTHSMLVVSPSRADTRGDTMMVRLISFEQQTAGTWLRKTQQLYYANSNTADANALLRSWGVLGDDDVDLDEIAILNQPQLMRKDRLPEGVVAVAEMLDTFAAERTGKPVFCGTPMPETPARQRYQELEAVSRRREQEVGPRISQVAAETLALVRAQNLSFAQENHEFKRLFLANLRLICSDHPEYAEAAFGEQAAKAYRRAYDAAAAGDTEAAQTALGQAFEQSTTVIICDVVVTEETSQNAAQSQETAAKTQEEIKEALHCLELKVQGYTIRDKVNCPACSHVTGNKVRAYETVETIRCMNGDCGYKISKLDGSVIQESKFNLTKQDEEQAPIARVISLAERRLQSGRRYQVGKEQYEYREQIGIGAADPLFIASDGSELRGDVARQLQQSLTLSGAQAA